jgi:hypothetical protein
MTTISKKPQLLLEKLGHKVISIKKRKLDPSNTRIGNVGYTYNCVSYFGNEMKIKVCFHTFEKTFSMSGKNIKFRRKNTVNNTVFNY